MSTPQDEPKESTSFLHPASGALILGADWLLFSGTAATGGLAMALTVPLGFLIGAIGTTATQRFMANESWGKAVGKGFLAGLAVGAPFRARAAKALLESGKGTEKD